jgi:hypothetical protein
MAPLSKISQDNPSADHALRCDAPSWGPASWPYLSTESVPSRSRRASAIFAASCKPFLRKSSSRISLRHMRVQHCLSIDAAIFNEHRWISLYPVRKAVRPAGDERKNGMNATSISNCYPESRFGLSRYPATGRNDRRCLPPIGPARSGGTPSVGCALKGKSDSPLP